MKPKTKKIVRYSILCGLSWALPVFYAETWPSFLIQPTTGFNLLVLSILGTIFMAFALRNFATRKTPTKKEKTSLEKENLEKRVRELEEKSKSDDNPENS